MATGGVDPAVQTLPRKRLSFGSQVCELGAALRNSDVHLRLIGLGLLLLSVILATTYMQVRLNAWNAPFYNAIAQRDGPGFSNQLVAFGWIAGSLVVLNVIQTWADQRFQLHMRRGIAGDLLELWMRDDNARRLRDQDSDISVNPDQRIHQDARNLAEQTTALSIGVVQAGILLASFIGILWNMSQDFSITVHGQTYLLPGYMVWAAIAYAGLASLISGFIGGNLVTLNAEREAREAELRSALVDANSHLDTIAADNRQAETLGLLTINLDAVLKSVWRIALSQTNLTWISAGFGWLAIVVPILVAAPVYLSGRLTFGGLMVAVGAFNQVHNALRWYVNNFQPIATWKAHLLRVTSFRHALANADLEGMAKPGFVS